MLTRVICLECGAKYYCRIENTTFTGSIIETTCPFCNKTIKRNISKFLEIQTENIRGNITQAKTMIAMARAIDFEIHGKSHKQSKIKVRQGN